MQLHNLVDPTSALIVVGGTVAATILRCGLDDASAAARALGGLGRRGFDAKQVRAELSVHVREMQHNGVIRTEAFHLGDSEFDEATEALISKRSLSALHGAHISHKRRRAEQSVRAVRTFTQAADLSPIFGLAGTLISLSQLPSANGIGANFADAISMAVLTTLYGLLLGNFIFAPLSRLVARAAAREERARQEVLDWLEKQVAGTLPHPPEPRFGHAHEAHVS